MPETSRAPESPAQVRGARRLVAVGATLSALGIALSLDSAVGFAGAVTVCGLLATLVGLHRIGRLGPAT
jgi:hypothetical protein